MVWWHGASKVPLYAVGIIGLDYAGRKFYRNSIDQSRHLDAQSALAIGGRYWGDQLTDLFAAERVWRSAGAIGGEDSLSEAVRKSVGFAACCRVSSVSNGGDGVFAHGDVPQGGVVSVYAGERRGEWDTILDLFGRLFVPWLRSNDHCLAQSDGSSLDGASRTSEFDRQSPGYVSPSSCGHLVNHPPRGVNANASFLTVRISRDHPAFDSLPLALVSSWPKWLDFGYPAIVPLANMTVTLIVALVPISDGHEVFVNYRLSSLGSEDKEDEVLPVWYVKQPSEAK